MIIDEDYVTLGKAYDYINTNLFDGSLPPVILTLQRKKGAKGYMAFERFETRNSESKIRASEIALNPDCFRVSTDLEILSTVAHEMCHLWEYIFEEPSRKSYHTKVWAKKMHEIGLIPTSTGDVGGKETGQKVTHYIDDDGPFSEIVGAFLLDKKIEWQSLVEEEKEKVEKPKKIKFVYNCPNCVEVEVTSKTEIRIICGDCDAELVLQEQDEPE